MELYNDKYVVFKHDEFNEWAEGMRQAVGHTTLTLQIHLNDIRLEDAVVIRPRDIFAGPGLSAYAMAIQTAIDLLLLDEAPPDSLDQRTFDQLTQLQALRDFFMEQSLAAMGATDKHLPD